MSVPDLAPDDDELSVHYAVNTSSSFAPTRRDLTDAVSK